MEDIRQYFHDRPWLSARSAKRCPITKKYFDVDLGDLSRMYFKNKFLEAIDDIRDTTLRKRLIKLYQMDVLVVKL